MSSEWTVSEIGRMYLVHRRIDGPSKFHSAHDDGGVAHDVAARLNLSASRMGVTRTEILVEQVSQ